MTDDIILLAHGSGGRKSSELISELFLRHLGNPALDALGDSAILSCTADRLAFTTDSFVVSPIMFPGGDIGKLAVCGTVNDLAASGAVPLALSAAFVLEEGLETATLEEIVASMSRTAAGIPVPIVAGDTKVVPRGAADQMFITTSGIGVLPAGLEPPTPERAAPSDMVIISGTIADHGMAVMTCREGIRLSSEIASDCAPLHEMTRRVLEACGEVHCMRDPTRGGLAASLNEIALQSGACIEVDEDAIPVREDVRVACEMLGIDPLHVANEGKMLFVLPASSADAALKALREDPLGRCAAAIGRVTSEPIRQVHLRTTLGALRVLDIPSGELLPRIC